MKRRRIAVSAGVAGAVAAVAAVLVLPALLDGSGSRAVPAAAARTNAVAVSTSAVSVLTATSSLAPSSVPMTPAHASPAPTSTGVASVTPISTQIPVPRPLTNGVTVGANGGVVAIPGKPVRWCPGSFATDDIYVAYAPGKQPPATWCPTGVNVIGVDLSALSLRKVSHGVTWGYAYLRGVYRDGTVAVTTQTGNRQELGQPMERWNAPPCPSPAKGWLTVGKDSNPDAVETTVSNYGRAHPGAIVNTVQFRPTSTSAVVVVVAENPAAVRAALPQDPSSICVVAARASAAAVKAASLPFENDLRHDGTEYGTYGLEQDTGEDAQLTVVAQVAWLTPKIEALVASAPPGLLVVRTWLTPIAPDAPLPPAIATAPVSTADDSTTTAVPTTAPASG